MSPQQAHSANPITVAGKRPADRSLAQEIAVVLAALFLYRLGSQIPLPGLSPDILDQLLATNGPLGRLGADRISIFCLGLMPVLNALVLAELLMLSSWLRAKVEASPRTRSNARATVFVVGLLFAALQGLGVAVALEMMQGAVDPDWPFRLTCVATAVAATAFLIWLAEIVTRHGLGRGFWVLLIAPFAGGVLSDAAKLQMAAQSTLQDGRSDGLIVALFVVGAVALVVAFARAAPSLMDRDQLLWPPILASTLAGWIPLAAELMLDPETPLHAAAINAASPLRLGALALLVLLIAILRARSQWRAATPGKAGTRFVDTSDFRMAVMTALALASILVGGYLVGAATAVPLSFDGQALILMTVVALTMMRRA